MSVESNVVFALVLLYFALWLAKIARATFSTNQKLNQNQSWLDRTRFAALGVSRFSDWFILFFVPVVIG